MYVIAALIDRDKDSVDKLLNFYNYLAHSYSFISFLGVLMLLICTPLGFARLFTVIGDLVIKPTFMRNVEEEFLAAKFEEDNLKRKLSEYEVNKHVVMAPVTVAVDGLNRRTTLKNGEVLAHYQTALKEVSSRRAALDRARKTPAWRRILGYPLVMMVLLTLTALALLCVVTNLGQIMAGLRTLPLPAKKNPEEDLGSTSLSSFGALGGFGGGFTHFLLAHHLSRGFVHHPLDQEDQARDRRHLVDPHHPQLRPVPHSQLRFAADFQNSGHHQFRLVGLVRRGQMVGPLLLGAALQRHIRRGRFALLVQQVHGEG